MIVQESGKEKELIISKNSVQTPLRVGVVGMGKMGLLHTAIFNTLPESCVVAVADPAPFPREPLSTLNPSFQMFEKMEEMLDATKLDAVAITTPVAHHVPAALACVQRHIPFFVEKPLSVSATQASDLLQAMQESQIPHMVGFMTRFIDSFEKGKEIILSNCLGRIQRVTGTIYSSQLFRPGKGWRYDRRISGGGVLMGQGSHLIDLLTWYFGPVVRVNSGLFSIYSVEVEDFAHVMLEFRSGVRGWLDSSWSVRSKRTVETTIDVLGDNGSLLVTDDTIRLVLDQPAGVWPSGRTILRASDMFRSVPIDVGGPQYTREDQTFARALISKTTPQPGVYQALHVQRIIDAAYASSLESGSPKEVLA